jgi:hypothetical protein
MRACLRSHQFVVLAAVAAVCLGAIAAAQARPRGQTAQAPARGAAAQTPARGAPAAGSHVDANLLQVMRGIVYPASNVVFAAQSDLSEIRPVADPSVSPNPLTSTYGGWQAVENAALALSESANLIMVSGRLCSNGKPVPVQRADWRKYAQGLGAAGRAAYKAAQSRNQDAMVDVSGTVADSCSACHEVYREKLGGGQDRCVP